MEKDMYGEHLCSGQKGPGVAETVCMTTRWAGGEYLQGYSTVEAHLANTISKGTE